MGIFTKKHSSYRHLILTHFNIRWKTASTKGRYELFKKPLTEEWMDHRFKLFEKYCYPSIVNQTNQDFEWLVFFDPTITDNDRLKQFDRITPIFIPPGHYFTPQYVCDYIGRVNFQFLISTNLDNDDSLNLRYVEMLHDFLSPNHTNEIVEFTRGYLFDHYTGETRFYDDEYGPFMSLIESPNRSRTSLRSTRLSRGRFKTIRMVDHRHIVKRLKCKYTAIHTDDPMWLQVVHDKNAKNLMDRGYTIQDEIIKFPNLFNVDVDQGQNIK